MTSKTHNKMTIDQIKAKNAKRRVLAARARAEAAERETKQIDKTLQQIAAKHLDIETLEERKSDGWDFHEVAVWNLKAALHAAYEAGRQSITKD